MNFKNDTYNKNSTPLPNLDAVVEKFPWAPLRNNFLDWIAFQLSKTPQRVKYRLLGKQKIPPHQQLLGNAINETLRIFGKPICIETGCIRDVNEGTKSTLAIVSTLNGEGNFFTFELEPSHIEICKEICQSYLDRIRFVSGDAIENLKRFRKEGRLKEIHFAFLDSAPNPNQIFLEFKAIEECFVRGILVIIDDVIRGNKGSRIKTYLYSNPAWESRIVLAGNGLLVSKKLHSV